MSNSYSEYVDVRELHPDFDHRECPCCGTEWYYKEGLARGIYCPNCQSRPLFRRLAEEYAKHYAKAEKEDESNVKPPDYHHAIPKAMAYEASEALGFEVNHFHCMDYIFAWMPEGARRDASEYDEPDTKTTRRPDMIINGPTEEPA